VPAGLPRTSQIAEHGLLLVGHGTRNTKGLGEFRAVAKQVADQAGDCVVEACFLELAEPDIATGVRRLLERGVRRITVAPVLLFAAGHAKRDIPAAVDSAVGGRQKAGGEAMDRGAADENGVVVDYLGALECDARILELSAQRYADALAGRPAVDAAETLLVLVGRGSSDVEAIQVMQRFAQLRAERSGVGRAEVCFVAVAKPKLEEALDRAARSEFQRIVVQPHLLFEGEVLDVIQRQLTAISSAATAGKEKKEWILTEHLGASPLVAGALVQMMRKRHAG
jgi:sirohydrochlorin cobaltochelatase